MFGARFEMVPNNSTVTHCQHLPILLNCQRNISIKSRFKSPTVTFTKRQNKKPKTHRARFSWLFLSVWETKVVYRSLSISCWTAQLIWLLPGTTVIRWWNSQCRASIQTVPQLPDKICFCESMSYEGRVAVRTTGTSWGQEIAPLLTPSSGSDLLLFYIFSDFWPICAVAYQ